MFDMPFVSPVRPKSIQLPSFLRPPKLEIAAPIPKTGKLPNLTDPAVEKEIGKKYEYLVRMFPIIETAFNTWVVVNGILTSQDFIDTGTTFPTIANYVDGMKNIFGAFGKPQYYFRQIGDKVQVKLNSIPIKVEIGYGERDTYYARRTDRDIARTNSEKLVQEFIPSFKLPGRWKREAGKMYPIIDGLEPGPSNPIEVWSQKEFNWTPTDRYKGTDRFPAWTKINLGHQYTSGYSGMLRLRFTIDEESLEFNADSGNRPPRDIQEGPLTGISGLLLFDILPVFFVTYPLEYALWATSATNQNDFLPKQFVTQINKLMVFAARGSKRKEPEPRLGSFPRLRQLVNNKIREFDLQPESRTNEDDFTILTTGRIAWVPRGIDTIDKYQDLLRSAYDPETHKVKPNSKIEGLPNQIIYSDWVHNKLTYTTEDGNVHVMDLNGSIPLDNISIHKELIKSINDKMVRGFITETIPAIASQLGIEYEIEMPANLSQYRHLSDRKINLQSAHTFLWQATPLVGGTKMDGRRVDAKMYQMSFYEIVGGALEQLNRNLEDSEEVEKPYWRAAVTITGVIRHLCIDILQRWNEIDCPITSKIGYLRFFLIAATKYAPDHRKYSVAFQEAEKKNSATPTNRYAYNYEAPNLPNLQTLMPHQAEIVADFIENDPTNCILSVSAGGGKTLIQAIKGMMALEQNKAKRVGILMPKRIIPDFVTEINDKSGGMINPFVLTKDTLQNVMQVMRFKTVDLVKFLRSLPHNTFFISYYRFLSGAFDIEGNENPEIPYGDTMIEQLPIAELIRAIGIDWLSLDESHGLRNQNTQQAAATLQLVSAAKIKTLSTGTLISNSPTDLVGQMSLINPRAYNPPEGSNVKPVVWFANEYGNGDNTNVQLIGEGRTRALHAMLPYVKRDVKLRKTWAFLLPDMHENERIVTLTPKQAEFYVGILQEAIVQIRKSMIKARLDPDADNSTNPKEEDPRIEIILRQHLARVEQFIGAPDNDRDYVNLADRPTGKDLVSPLVPMVDRIVAAHLKGIEIAQEGDDLGITPDPENKILIFSHHIAVADHCYRHMQARNLVIHYTGSDQQLVDFRTNPRIKILVGPSGRVKEGLNLQIASRIIDLELPWTPGYYEQEISRIFRPDFNDKRVRSELQRDIIITKLPDGTLINGKSVYNHPAVSALKFGRLISKIIETSKILNADEPNWKKVERDFATTSLIRLNIHNLTNFTFDDLNDHFDTFKRYRQWEERDFIDERDHLRRTVEAHVGRPITSRQELVQEAMIPFNGKKVLPGSRLVYVPFVTGAKIADRYGLGELTPLANIVERDDIIDEESIDVDDDRDPEEREQDAVNIRVGMPVITEFGPGVIATVLKGSIRVDIPGLGKVTLKRSVVFTPSTQEGINKLLAILRQAGAAGLPTLRPGGGLVDIVAPTIGPEGKIPTVKPLQRPTFPPVIPGGPQPEVPTVKPGIIGQPPKVPPIILPRPQQPRVIQPGVPTPQTRPGPATPPITTPPIIRMKPGTQPPTGIPTITMKPGTPITQQIEQRPKPEGKIPVPIIMQEATVNGTIALILGLNSVNPGPLVAASRGWHIVPPFISVHITRQQTLRNLLNWLLVRYTIPDQVVNQIIYQAQRFATTRGQLIHARPTNFNDIRNFFLMEHRKIPVAQGRQKQMILPWLVVLDGQVYLAFDIHSHPANVIANLRRLRTLFHDSGIGQVAIHPAMLMALFTTKNAAINELARVSEQINISNLPDIRSKLSETVLNVTPKEKR